MDIMDNTMDMMHTRGCPHPSPPPGLGPLCCPATVGVEAHAASAALVAVAVAAMAAVAAEQQQL